MSNPLRALLGYMRGDDIREANARTLARNQADLAADRALSRGTPGPASPAPAVSAPPAVPGR